ncbi:MAG: hypothetical protein EOO77_14625 [Oxalobacteraceae bacterium]|nr:MAG: hypothetical protein EOO77_14625 [Oxalobacteraceae bacterium]
MKELARARFVKQLKQVGKNKTRATMELVGCSKEQLVQHIEQQFQQGMSWQNHGNGPHKWNVDHIIPCSAFDFTSEEEQDKCFHYSNLQPLWFIDNMKKGSSQRQLPVARSVNELLDK